VYRQANKFGWAMVFCLRFYNLMIFYSRDKSDRGFIFHWDYDGQWKKLSYGGYGITIWPTGWRYNGYPVIKQIANELFRWVIR
jgi:hypothetical protein